MLLQQSKTILHLRPRHLARTVLTICDFLASSAHLFASLISSCSFSHCRAALIFCSSKLSLTLSSARNTASSLSRAAFIRTVSTSRSCSWRRSVISRSKSSRIAAIFRPRAFSSFSATSALKIAPRKPFSSTDILRDLSSRRDSTSATLLHSLSTLASDSTAHWRSVCSVDCSLASFTAACTAARLSANTVCMCSRRKSSNDAFERSSISRSARVALCCAASISDCNAGPVISSHLSSWRLTSALLCVSSARANCSRFTLPLSTSSCVRLCVLDSRDALSFC